MEVRWTSMPPNGRAVDRRTPGTKGEVARSGVPFHLVAFLWASKEKRPRVQGRSHPQLAFYHRRSRHNIKEKPPKGGFCLFPSPLPSPARGEGENLPGLLRQVLQCRQLDLTLRVERQGELS